MWEQLFPVPGCQEGICFRDAFHSDAAASLLSRDGGVPDRAVGQKCVPEVIWYYVGWRFAVQAGSEVSTEGVLPAERT